MIFFNFFWYSLRILGNSKMPFKFMSTVDKTGSPSPPDQIFWTLYRGNYRILTSLVCLQKGDCGNSAINSVRIWTLLTFLNFRCQTTPKYCPLASLSIHSFLTTVFHSIPLWQSQWREPPKQTPQIVLKSRTHITCCSEKSHRSNTLLVRTDHPKAHAYAKAPATWLK